MISQKAGWLQLSQKVDLGLMLLVELASSGVDEPVSLRKIAEKNGFSFYFLQKVAYDLRNAGIISSGRGKLGGYRLAKDPNQIIIKDIVEAHEGPLAIMHCLPSSSEDGGCSRCGSCSIRPGLNFINEKILQTLSSTTLADFLNLSSS